MVAEHREDRNRRIGTGWVFPSRYSLDGLAPQSLFPEGASPSGHSQSPRYVHMHDPNILLVYTDGACPNNGRGAARGGCGVVFGPRHRDALTGFGFRENKGPTGEVHEPTNNRAELRAVIAATRLKDWAREGFTCMFIATDSAYVVNGITNWIRDWIPRGWRTHRNQRVENRDLWECLLGEVERCYDNGLELVFWHISRDLNTRADAYARAGAEQAELPEFRDWSACSS